MAHEKSTRTRKIIAVIFFGIVILVMGYFMLFKPDVIFRQRVVITYPDGCVEEVINGKLTTPECTEGRALQEEYENMRNRVWNQPLITGPVNMTT